ncbi:hypothetical protein M422DRAFT_44423 [Sphaerobolus stellatus SS14]|nr:hypothetical protein M422DRAFT_44423 [Sphaerobolus stellatus SS14]
MPYIFDIHLKLETHTKPINSVAFHPAGRLFIAGGDDSILSIWDSTTGSLIGTIEAREHGQITRVLWIVLRTLREASFILFGCADGTFHQYLFDEDNHSHTRIKTYGDTPSPVNALVYTSRGAKAAVLSGSSLNMWQMQDDYRFRQIWSYSHSANATAMSAHFMDNGFYIIVLFLETSELFKLRASSGTVCEYARLKTRIGTTALSESGDYLLVGNLCDGVDVYNTHSCDHITSLRVPMRVNVLKQVNFAIGDQLIMSGSDNGTVIVWDRDGNVTYRLKHNNPRGLVQTVQSFCRDDMIVIISAMHDPDGSNISLQIWQGYQVSPSGYWLIHY